MKKKHLYFFFSFSLLFFSFSTFSTTLEQPLTVILDWFPNPDHAPLFVALEKGYFKKEGLNIKLISPSDPTEPSKLVAAGKAEVAITYYPELIMDVSKGLPLVRFATLIDTPLNCLVVNANGPILTLADLKNKTIGYSMPEIDKATLSVMLRRVGLTLKEVKLVNVHFNLTQALLTHRVDAVIGMVRNFELLQMALQHSPGRAFYPEENGIPLYDELIFVTHPKYLHDQRIAHFVRALNEATSYLLNHPQECWQLFVKAHPELNNALNEHAWFATLNRFNHSPAALDRSRYEHYSAFLKKEGVIKKNIDLNQYAVGLAYP